MTNDLAPPRAPTARILVVDDEPDLGALVAAILDAAGYRPSVVTGAGAVLVHVRARPPDLILTDLSMPAMDGLALDAELHREGYGGIPILLMSARERPPGVPPEAFLAKPFDLATLLGAVQRMLGPPTGRAGPRDHRAAHSPGRRTR